MTEARVILAEGQLQTVILQDYNMKNKDLAIYTLIALIGIALLTLLFANFKYIAPSNIEGKIKDA